MLSLLLINVQIVLLIPLFGGVSWSAPIQPVDVSLVYDFPAPVHAPRLISAYHIGTIPSSIASVYYDAPPAAPSLPIAAALSTRHYIPPQSPVRYDAFEQQQEATAAADESSAQPIPIGRIHIIPVKIYSQPAAEPCNLQPDEKSADVVNDLSYNPFLCHLQN